MKSSGREEVTQSEAARRLGMTPQALGVWAKRPGAPVALRKGRPFCLWPDFPKWREAELDRVAREEARPREMSQTEAERRYESARAQKLEIEVARLEGQLVAAEDVEKAWGGMVHDLRAQLLTLPQRWAPAVIGCRGLPEVTAKLETALQEAMTALRDRYADG